MAGLGTLYFVVGASGAGKDTLVGEALKRLPYLHKVRRVVTRPAGPDDDHEPMEPEAFLARRRRGGFVLSWDANGNRYGVTIDMLERLRAGQDCILVGSRAIVDEVRRMHEPVIIVHVTAPLDVIARRLRERGREDEMMIQGRMGRAGRGAPRGPDVATVDNGGALEDSVPLFLAALETSPCPTRSLAP